MRYTIIDGLLHIPIAHDQVTFVRVFFLCPIRRFSHQVCDFFQSALRVFPGLPPYERYIQ